jgi:hypothetical protein
MSKFKRRKLKEAKEPRFTICNLCQQKAKLTKFHCCIRCAYASGRIDDPLTGPLVNILFLNR